MAGTAPRAHPSHYPTEFQPFRIAGGLAVYRLGRGEPVLLMPAPHRFERVGLAGFDTLIDGLLLLGRQVITQDPPGSGRSTGPARVSVDEVLECTDRALDACYLAAPTLVLCGRFDVQFAPACSASWPQVSRTPDW